MARQLREIGQGMLNPSFSLVHVIALLVCHLELLLKAGVPPRVIAQSY